MTEDELKRERALLAAWEEMLRKDSEAICTVTENWVRAMKQQRREWWFHSLYCFLCGTVCGAALMKLWLI